MVLLNNNIMNTTLKIAVQTQPAKKVLASALRRKAHSVHGISTPIFQNGRRPSPCDVILPGLDLL